jgi:hypothetical protein
MRNKDRAIGESSVYRWRFDSRIVAARVPPADACAKIVKKARSRRIASG